MRGWRMGVSSGSYPDYRPVQLRVPHPLIQALFLLTCTVVFQDFHPITSDLAPGGMPGWRHDIQVEICADWPAWT